MAPSHFPRENVKIFLQDSHNRQIYCDFMLLKIPDLQLLSGLLFAVRIGWTEKFLYFYNLDAII